MVCAIDMKFINKILDNPRPGDQSMSLLTIFIITPGRWPHVYNVMKD